MGRGTLRNSSWGPWRIHGAIDLTFTTYLHLWIAAAGANPKAALAPLYALGLVLLARRGV